DLDITGLSYAMLEAQGPQQWPLPEGASAGRARLYEDGVFPTADGRARFADVAYTPLAEPRDARYPFSLLTGRLRDQWHGMSRTGLLGRLYGHDGLPSVELHPQDLARLRVREGDLLRLRSRRGQVVLSARASDRVAPTLAFVAMHWGSEVLGGEGGFGVNGLTSPAFCPTSKQPELKHCAVAIEKVELPWRLTAMAWLPEGEAQAVRARLQGALGPQGGFGYACLLPFGREPDAKGRAGVLLRAGASVAPDRALLDALREAFGLAGAEVLAYQDARRG
ncbi:MAG TPA: molybdopterin dinucleotide binding domain-containing protein, partial [Burkholderiaceae bacterium]|nr:molybdopterin dinucleotide binding domain-containing protein [Burkholderiaceae bacterium]